ncbi:uncharacterized protein LOC131624809 [Vicia villosa]|uniref:uncharacterized protein LOC131624809 n=1 Tax=Vicia villosa TaxID=3911 RepID=UPI00273B83DD|nr:uncharacterized protein LOC131624809 [Vicia villosa]
MPPPSDAGSPVPPPDGMDPLHREAGAPEVPYGYPGGPSNLSMLTGVFFGNFQDRASQKFYNHGREILSLRQPTEPWFQDVLKASGLKNLCHIGYTTIHNEMLIEFVERWHPKMFSSHLLHGEVTITLDDIACLLHIPIRGTLLCHGRMTKEEAERL